MADRDGDGAIQDTYSSKHNKIEDNNTTMKITENIEIYHSQSRRHGHKPTHRRTAETDREDIGCIQKWKQTDRRDPN